MTKRCNLAFDPVSQLANHKAGPVAWGDPDLEIGSWPEMIDQSRLWDPTWQEEDDEDDDLDTSIEDQPHDIAEEDGI